MMENNYNKIMDNLYSKAKDSMNKSLEHLKNNFLSVNTGRATPDLLNTVRVEFYGSIMPLNQVSNISVSDALTLTVQVWDKSMVTVVEKAITQANLGFNPKVEGQTLRINIPRLTEERRKELCKLTKKYGEDAKVSVRNARRDVLDDAKKNKSDYSEDELKKFNTDIQTLTDEFIKKIDDTVISKEKDIMTI